jgi:hypothetical protein
MKNLPIGIYTFSDIVKDNYLYIDKTKEIYKFFTEDGRYYFLARPRRFGKSLMVSTLNEIFSGNKELFKGLWIEDKIDWKSYPVILINFLGTRYESKEELTNTLDYLLEQNAQLHGIKLKEKGYDKRFKELIMELSKKERVVILVDEYDKPIIDFIEKGKQKTALDNRDVLKTFYSVIKWADKYLKFVFITGVSKFSRVSIFSDLNNLDDITIDDRFSTLLGCTHEELSKYFNDHIEHLGRKMGISEKELLEHMQHWYNGYSWDGCNFLYNPFSILKLFSKNRFGNYWFTTGTPSFLIDHIKNRRLDINRLERVEADESIFERFDIENLETFSMLFQTGYLTIKEIKMMGIKSKYILSYPNQEVKESFLKHFLASYTSEEAGTVGSKILDLVEAIKNHHLEEFFTIIRSLFAKIPSELFIKEREAYYHTVIFIILKLVGVDMGVDAEVHTNKGSIDAVLETKDMVYVLEFKMDTSYKALAQIESRGYHEKYLSSGKKITLIGIGFDSKEKNISDYQEKEI